MWVCCIAAFGEWWQGVASHKVVVKDVYEKILTLESLEGHKIGVIGFCWGGLESILLGQDKDRFKCVAAIHPAQVTPEIIQQLTVPVYFGPADGDFEANKAENELKSVSKKLARDSVFHRYHEMQHGFCAARGDWMNLKIWHQVEICVQETGKFFKKQLR